MTAQPGEDLVAIPVGTVVHNLTIGSDQEIVKIGEQVLVAKGGHGGKGNFLFRGPHATSPKDFRKVCLESNSISGLSLK